MELSVIVSLAAVWLLVVYFFYRNRIWLLYYLVGAIGLAFIIIFVGRAFFLEAAMEQVVAQTVHQICNLAGIPTKIFESAPGALLVMVIAQDIGWTVIQIGIECSGLLETSAMLGMVLLYPGWAWGKRLVLTAIGVITIYFANIIRLFFIVEILHHGGKDTIFISHTIAGRAIFFIIVVGIYWFVITRPTLSTIRNKLHKEMAV